MKVLNVGGGSKAIPLPIRWDGWEHVLLDIVDGPDVDVVMDARALEGVQPSHPLWGCDGVYASHFLEHFTSREVPAILRGFWNVLAPGGFLELHVPDLKAVCRNVASGHDLEDVAYTSPAGQITYLDMLYGYGRKIEENPYMQHKTGFTSMSLRRHVRSTGFKVLQVVSEGFEIALFAEKPPKG